jgi:hypothetical protein
VTDYDQVVIHLGKHVVVLLQYIGGPSEAATLITLIEPLCNAEETIVRDTITKSLCSILAVVPPDNEETMKSFFEMTQRLYEGIVYYCTIYCKHTFVISLL